MLSGVALNRAKGKARFSSEAKARAPSVQSEDTSLVPSRAAKIAPNSSETNTLYAFGEAKASASKVLLSSAKTVSPSKAKPHSEAILALLMVKREASKAKSKASQPKKVILQSRRVSMLDRLGPVNTDLRDYLNNKRKLHSEESIHISPS